ncbi:4Fe-4S dicluster domain-containing protein [Acetonema longum]|uniref:4Fe-4S ferredoxin iron-sulfur binding domain protein n=1 Tax=Acetonema longum DSM 6540 TaxID=1009370 RepID=F7NMK4_9FIRM|nr:4Fe-4S dicluster domain-containing protein [Acetonema longum]EGO62744.1 4Fe-4S ferredoxin iron-sulfur binding domain protein [Acetonema longum DSM 6540]
MERGVKAALFIGGIVALALGGFSGRKAKSGLIRPPGAVDEALFLSTCLRCGQCAQVCPQKAIRIGYGDKGISLGTPYIEPRQAACNLCMDCARVCPSRALRETAKENVRMGLAEINQDACLAWQGDECKICYTSCPFFNRAIQLEDHKRPVVNRNVCAGCGICEYVCIASPAAVTVKAGR